MSGIMALVGGTELRSQLGLCTHRQPADSYPRVLHTLFRAMKHERILLLTFKPPAHNVSRGRNADSCFVPAARARSASSELSTIL